MHIENFGFMSLNDVCHRPLALVPELYIDDRILVSTSPEGLQQQLDALRNLAAIQLHGWCVTLTAL